MYLYFTALAEYYWHNFPSLWFHLWDCDKMIAICSIIPFYKYIREPVCGLYLFTIYFELALYLHHCIHYIYIHVLLKRMAHSLFIIFFLVFSYFLISFIFLWSFCKISIIVLKEGATFRFTRTIFRLKIVYGNLNRSKIGFIIP